MSRIPHLPNATGGTARGLSLPAALAALSLCVTALPNATLFAQDAKTVVARSIDARQAHYADVALQIWSFAELGFQESRSSGLLQQQLSEAGFTVRAGVADMPTAFVAEWGSGEPVIGILAEFDALPGLSQDTVPSRQPIVEGGSGHGCGHNLYGTASTAAAIAVKQWLEESQTKGTIRLYGTPAEEGGDGKVYMVMDGEFKDADAVLSWHPGDRNDASPSHNLAVISAYFRFHGVAAHAAAAPDRGRSALDAAEAMDMMVNQLREHVPQTTRIHNVIRNGGLAPNVVPDYAESEYYVRHPSADTAMAILQRVVDAAKGAALGTGTTMDYEIFNGSYAHLTNQTLARLMDANLRRVGGVTYSPEETAFAEEMQTTLGRAPARSHPCHRDPALRYHPHDLRLLRRRGRELGCAHDGSEHGDLGPRHRRPHLAGGGGGRDEHWQQRAHRGRQDPGHDGGGPVHHPEPRCSRRRPSSSSGGVPDSTTIPSSATGSRRWTIAKVESGREEGWRPPLRLPPEHVSGRPNQRDLPSHHRDPGRRSDDRDGGFGAVLPRRPRGPRVRLLQDARRRRLLRRQLPGERAVRSHGFLHHLLYQARQLRHPPRRREE